MKRSLLVAVLPLALLVPLVASLGCKTFLRSRPYREPPPPDLKPTTLDYADTDGFDALFETALTNEDPAIVVRTGRQQPDWGPRLNAWIAAWNRGGRVEAPKGSVRLQAPLLSPVSVDADSIREFRLLIDDLMDRVEVIAHKESAWWAEERIRGYRVALLKPYNLRFHLDEEQHIQLIFFNGNYAESYPQFVRLLNTPEQEEPGQWSRTVHCSRCKQAASAVPTDRLMGRSTAASP
jgi:hypothetical protein